MGRSAGADPPCSRRGHSVAAEKAKTGDQAAALDLAGDLVQQSAADAELARMVRHWITEATDAVAGGAGSTVTNVISGHARIHGDVVQARDIGSVRFGRDDTSGR